MNLLRSLRSLPVKPSRPETGNYPARTLALLCILLACLGVGCSQLPGRPGHARAPVAEEFRPAPLGFARQDQRFERFPPQSFDPQALPATNHPGPGAHIQNQFPSRFAWQDHPRAGSPIFIHHGCTACYGSGDWRNGLGWAGVGAFLALLFAVLFPTAFPVLGRILAWLVAKAPGLSGALGVVSVQAFDALVRGIEQAKMPQPEPRDLANSTEALHRATRWPDQLHDHLSREMDASHKRLVRHRKIVISRARS